MIKKQKTITIDFDGTCVTHDLPDIGEDKELGFIIVFGVSDDLAELRGVIHDEVGAWKGTIIYFDKMDFLQIM